MFQSGLVKVQTSASKQVKTSGIFKGVNAFLAEEPQRSDETGLDPEAVWTGASEVQFGQKTIRGLMENVQRDLNEDNKSLSSVGFNDGDWVREAEYG